ncbi:MAG: glycerate kinase, partial [Puia sp.]
MSAIRHGGAAGGAAATLHVFLNANLFQGIDYFLDITGFDTALLETDILITGEGSIDLQTLNGKGPYGVATRARKKGMIVIGLAGAIPLGIKKELSVYFDSLFAIGHQPEDPATALKNTFANLERTAMQIGILLDLSRNRNVRR